MATGSHDDLFKGIYQRQYARLVRYIRLYNFGLDDARDLAQDAFVRFYEHIDDYRAESEWGFLQKVARNLMSNRWRALSTIKRTAHVVELESVGEIPDPSPDPVERLQTAHRQKQLYDAIETLSPAQKAAVFLWLKGFGYEEIAQVLRITIDAVKSRLRDAKKALRERLGDEPTAFLPEDER